MNGVRRIVLGAFGVVTVMAVPVGVRGQAKVSPRPPPPFPNTGLSIEVQLVPPPQRDLRPVSPTVKPLVPDPVRILSPIPAISIREGRCTCTSRAPG